MTVLTPRQIANHARKAGFRGPALTWAVAVALAESGGRTDATYHNSDKYHSVDRGLWQINNHWHPEVTDAQAFDPDAAAAAAYRISNGGKSWTPWSTFKNGHARAQYDRARLATHPRAAGAASAPAAGSAAPSPKAPGVGSTGGGSTPGNTHSPATSSTQDASLLGDGLKGALGGAGMLLPGGLGGAALESLNGADPLSGAKALGNAATTAAKLGAGIVTALFDPHTYVRGAFIVAGSAAVLMGAYLLAKSGDVGSVAQGAAKSAGNAAKGAAKLAAVA